MGVVVKRKLMLFYWKNDKFLELAPDIILPEIPKTVAWCSDTLCVGFRTDYILVDVLGKKTELFPIGKYPEPIVARFAANGFVLGIDEKAFLLDCLAEPMLKYPITWSEPQVSLIEDPPYLVALLPSSVIEIRTAEPRLFVQKIEEFSAFPNVKIKQLIKCVGKSGQLFVYSNKDLFCLAALPIDQQISQFIEEKELDLATKLTNMCPDLQIDGVDSKVWKENILKQIDKLQACYYFSKKEFDKAMILFLKLETDPSHVIGFYPDLLPDDFRNKLEYLTPPPVLKGADLEAGIFALTDYLLEVRSCLKNLDGNPKDENEIKPFQSFYKSKDRLLQILDTTLVKCYLQTNDALVSSLVRIPDNHCHVKETEIALKRYHKYNELIIFYQSQKLHRKALDFLYKQAKKSDSYLPGHERTIQYLQHLGEADINLIFEYAEWVLKENPEDGLRIFTEDYLEIESLSRESVLSYLQRINQSLVTSYLEHIIYNWGERNPLFHNLLINRYREKIRGLMEKQNNDGGQSLASIENDNSELGSYRKKLLHFLMTSDCYSLETIPTFLLNDGLWEERALVAGKMGNHQEALFIYVYLLNDVEKAEDYCIRTYDRNIPGQKDVYFLKYLKLKIEIIVKFFFYFQVFLTLLELYVSVPPMSAIYPNADLKKPDMDATQNLQEAIKLLKNHATKIDPIRALIILPSNIPLSWVTTFLETVTKHIVKEKHDTQIFRNLLLAQHLNVQNVRIKLHREHKIVIDESNQCKVCQKKLGKRYINSFDFVSN